MMRSLGYLRTLAVFGVTWMVVASASAQDTPQPKKPEAAPKAPADAAKPATAPAAKPAPVAVVDQQKFDFGEVWVNKQIKHAFTITNTGNAPLKIIKVKPSCGCTAAGQHPKVIAPGASGKFPFSLNTKKISGKFTKTIAITTNDPKNKQMRLSLTGKVKHHIDMTPRIAQFGRVQADSVLTRKVTLTNNTDTPLELSINKSASLGCFKAEIEETKPGKVFEVTITAQPPFKTGINRTTLNIDTNIDKQKRLDVICMATLPQRIEVRPDRIQLAPHIKTTTPRRVTLTNNGQTPVKVLSAAGTDNKIGVETKEIEPGKRYQITVTFPAQYVPPSPSTAIIVKTDDAEKPEVRIPIRALTRKTPPQKRERPAMKMLGKPAPEHKVAVHGGSEAQVGGKSEKVQFVTFYASWCGFCKRALPKIEKMYGKYKDNENVEFFVVNLDDRDGRRGRTEEQTLDHYKNLNLTMPLILDPEKKIGRDYKVTSFPTMVIVGKSGTVEAVHVGAAQGFDKTVANEIDLLLAGKTRADFSAAAKPAKAIGPAKVKSAPAGRRVVPVKGTLQGKTPKNSAATVTKEKKHEHEHKQEKDG